MKAIPGFHVAWPPNDTAPPVPAVIEYFAFLGVEDVSAKLKFCARPWKTSDKVKLNPTDKEASQD